MELDFDTSICKSYVTLPLKNKLMEWLDFIQIDSTWTKIIFFEIINNVKWTIYIYIKWITLKLISPKNYYLLQFYLIARF